MTQASEEQIAALRHSTSAESIAGDRRRRMSTSRWDRGCRRVLAGSLFAALLGASWCMFPGGSAPVIGMLLFGASLLGVGLALMAGSVGVCTDSPALHGTTPPSNRSRETASTELVAANPPTGRGDEPTP
jgi:hypothetical protein